MVDTGAIRDQFRVRNSATVEDDRRLAASVASRADRRCAGAGDRRPGREVIMKFLTGTALAGAREPIRRRARGHSRAARAPSKSRAPGFAPRAATLRGHRAVAKVQRRCITVARFAGAEAGRNGYATDCRGRLQSARAQRGDSMGSPVRPLVPAFDLQSDLEDPEADLAALELPSMRGSSPSPRAAAMPFRTSSLLRSRSTPSTSTRPIWPC